jgi:photosystem II stability/assembly factor-like uncharacterized protein
MAQLFTNNAEATLAGAITSAVQTGLVLTTGKGALFPNPSAGDYFLLTLDDGINVEIVKVTARSTDNITVVRGQEGTAAQSSFSVGTKAELRLTAGTMNAIATPSAASALYMASTYGGL